MGHFFKRLAAAFALACAACLFFALPATAWAEEYTIILTTETGDTSQGSVQSETTDSWGYRSRTEASERVEIKAVTEDNYSAFYYPYQMIYATPKKGYRFVAWVNLHDGSVFSRTESAAVYVKNYSPEQPIELQARFEALAEYTLHLIIEGADGSPRVQVGGRDYYQSTDINVYEGTELSIGVWNSVTCELDTVSSSPQCVSPMYGRPNYILMPSSDATVTFRFRPPSCVVTFDGIDIWADRRDLVEVGEHTTYTLPECPITKEGMVFCGWSVGMPGDTIGLLGDLKIYPIWRPEELPEGQHMLLVRSSYPLAYTRVNGEDQNYTDGYAHVTPLYFSPGDEMSIAVSGDSYYMEPFGVSLEGIEWPDGLDVQDLISAYRTVDPEKYWHFTMPNNDVNITFLMRPKSYSVKFDPNGGTGTMEPIETEISGIFQLPECTFAPPEGKVFDTWGIPYYGGYWQTYNPGTKSYTGAHSDTPHGTFYALWKDAAPCTHGQLEAVPGTDATCTKDGTESFWKCTQCGKMFSDEKAEHEIYAPVAIPGGHDWGEWVVTKEPTTTAEGEETRTCKRDPSHKETRAIPMVEMPITYEFSYGAGQAWAQESAVELRFIVKRSVDDDTSMTHFMKVAVDGTPVPPLGYDIQADSVDILLKPAYLDSLEVGEHVLTVTFDDGSVEAAFSIREAGSVIPVDPVGPTDPDGRSGLPTWAWGAIGVAGAGALVFAGTKVPDWLKKRRRAKRRRERLARLEASSSAETHAATRTETRTPHVRR